jgi:hypothetical protein
MIDLVQKDPNLSVEKKLEFRLEKSGSVTYISSGEINEEIKDEHEQYQRALSPFKRKKRGGSGKKYTLTPKKKVKTLK